MKFESEIIKEILDSRGHEKTSIHYQTECIESWVEENKGAYPKLCDYQSEWLNYIDENPIGNFPYETITDVTEATVYNVVPYAYKSAILKGNSEVVAGKNKCNMEEIQTGWLDGSSGEVVSNTGVYIPVKVSGTITISNFIHDKSRYVYEYDASGNYLGRNSVTTNTVTLSLNENTILIKIGFYDASLSVVKSLELQVEQGEVATEYEPYNSTLVSVKMPVLTTTGKNLFDMKNSNFITEKDGNYYPSSDSNLFDTYTLLPNTTYTISGIFDGWGKCFINGVGFGNFNSSGNRVTKNFTTDSTGVTTIFFGANTPTNALQPCYDFQLEIGNMFTSYEPFKSNILTVNEEVELRGIGEVQDELNLLTGELTQRIGEVALDGSESWKIGLWKNQVEGIGFEMKIKNDVNPSVIVKAISDKILYNSSNNFQQDGEYFDMVGAGNGETWIRMRILRSKLSTEDVEGFKKWLSQNNVKILYELSDKPIKSVDLSVVDQDGKTLSKIKPIEGTMNLHTTGETIKPLFSGEIPVEAITQNLASFIEE